MTAEFDSIVQQREQLEKLLLGNPEMEKKVQGIIRKVLIATAKATSRNIHLKNDPRQAYKAVKSAVYKRILGGNISILNRKRRSGATAPLSPAGRPRSQRTEQLMSYYGVDRGFILRFLNSGTGQRAVKGINNNIGFKGGTDERNPKRHYRSGALGNRGAITPRNFFAQAGQKEMEKAADEIGALIDKLIKQELQ